MPYAGCSSGNISKLKTGSRNPLPASRTITSFVNSVYRYADYENMLPVLLKLCGSASLTQDSIIPALTRWLYDTDPVVLPEHSATPKSKLTMRLRRQSFGDRLDRAMTLLNLSNSQLSFLINIDVSLISRYRSGIYSPHANVRLSENLSDALLSRAKRMDKTAELAALWMNSSPEPLCLELPEQSLKPVKPSTMAQRD